MFRPNPDDGRQPKTFGLNILIFNFLTFSLVNRIFLLKRTLWTKIKNTVNHFISWSVSLFSTAVLIGETINQQLTWLLHNESQVLLLLSLLVLALTKLNNPGLVLKCPNLTTTTPSWRFICAYSISVCIRLSVYSWVFAILTNRKARKIQVNWNSEKEFLLRVQAKSWEAFEICGRGVSRRLSPSHKYS